MMNYTKGEWKQEEFEMQPSFGEPIKHIFISSNSGEYSNRTLVDVGFWRDFPEDMVKANAHLISAAPMMYEALKQAKETIHAWHGDIVWDLYQQSPEMKKVNEAISKAEGKE